MNSTAAGDIPGILLWVSFTMYAAGQMVALIVNDHHRDGATPTGAARCLAPQESQ